MRLGFGDVAEATAVSPSEVLVNGEAPGETSLQTLNFPANGSSPPLRTISFLGAAPKRFDER